MKVCTWNVNSVNSRLERLTAFLDRVSPDVVCLQELKCLTEVFPTEPIEKRGYQLAVFGQKTYNGVAILSKFPISNVQKGFQDGVDDPAARFIVGTINGVRISSVYVPNGQEVGSDKYIYKLEWLKRLKAFYQKELPQHEKILVCGDFNIAPRDEDVHDPDLWRGKILCSGRERNALAAFQDLGFEDTHLLHHGNEKGLFTWWDYRQLAFPKNNGLRIDLIFANLALAKSCKETWIERAERKGEKPSDHAPYFVEITLQK